MGNIDVAGKRIFYSVPVTAGGQYVFLTEANPNDIPGTVDTAISIFDSTGTNLLASDDDAAPRVSSDSELFYRSPVSTTLCVMVEDWSTWAQQTPVLPNPNQFSIFVAQLGANQTLDTEPNDSSPQAVTLTPFTMGSGGFSLAMGGLDTAADVDTFSVTVPAGAAQISVTVPPIGRPVAPVTTTYGSTLQRFGVQVRSGSSVLASLFPPVGNVEAMSDELSVPLSPGTYTVAISRPPGFSFGANDFWAARFIAQTDNPPEVEPNDNTATAKPLTMNVDPNEPKRRMGFVLGNLAAGDAADVFSFTTAVANSTATLVCGSARSGSGLIGFTVELQSTSTLQSETETQIATINWGMGGTRPAVTLATAGTYYVRFTTQSRSATVLGTYYRCGLFVLAP